MEPPTKKRKSIFRIEMPCDDNTKVVIMEKLHQVRTALVSQFDRQVNNKDIIEHLLDFWIASEKNFSMDTEFTTFQKVTEDTNDSLFITTSSSMQKLMDIVRNHAAVCSQHLLRSKHNMIGHAAVMKFSCKQHSYSWSSSPYFTDNKFLVNHRMLHAFVTSGMLAVQYQRFAQAAGIGFISREKRQPIIKIIQECVEEQYQESTDESLFLELLYAEDAGDDGITVMSDARHGWRKNAQDSNIVAMGGESHTVIFHEHVTKADDPISQRHEALGTKKILDKLEETGIDVKMWVHDMNVTVNKEVSSKGILNQNDLWHGVKNLKKIVKAVTVGAKRDHGKTWHHELDDKLLPVATHAYWATRNCAGDPATLQQSLDSITLCYQNIHDVKQTIIMSHPGTLLQALWQSSSFQVR